MGCGDEKLSKYLTQTFTTHCKAMICQQVTLSGDAEGPKVADAVIEAEHRIEECLQRSKSEAGLADYEVRHWTGWQHHQTLSLLATWFLVRETDRGKKMDSCDHLPADSSGYCPDLARGVSVWADVAEAEG